MRPFLGLSPKERMYFAMLHDRSELEASIKEASLLLLGELEYQLLIDNPKVEIEWSMEMGKDYFSFPIPLAQGGEATAYVSFDYERGFFPCVGSDRSDDRGKVAFIEALSKNKSKLAGLGCVVDVDGSLSIQDPGLPVEQVTDSDIKRWRQDKAELAVGCMFNPGADEFADRGILKTMHAATQSMIDCFRK